MKNVIYLLENSNKKAKNIYPHSYIGSKLNYKPGCYWGSSKHPLLIKELDKDIENFRIQILEYVGDKNKINERELAWQRRYNVVENKKFYNLVYAGKKFTSLGLRWYHDPNTLLRGYFPKNKVPKGWQPGYKPLHERSNPNPKPRTGFKLGDPRLEKVRSESNRASAKRGADHKDTKIWILQDPDHKKHRVTGLYPFCKKHNLLASALQYSFITKKPIKKGKSRGWCVLEKYTHN